MDLGCNTTDKSSDKSKHATGESPQLGADEQLALWATEWIGKRDYLELLQQPGLPGLDELLSCGCSSAPSMSDSLSSPQLTVGMIHAVIARSNLVHGVPPRSHFVSSESAYMQASDHSKRPSEKHPHV